MKRKEEICNSFREESNDLGIGFVAVHVGAGYHSPSHELEYKEACKAACSKAMTAIKRGFSAKDVVTIAIATLEDFSCTNAGIGSNLTKSGTVECDASIMDGQSLTFGAVGALKGVRNPIQVASKLLEEEMKGSSALGLIPPIFLAGEGGFQWAMEHGLTTCHDEDLITDRSTQTWKKCKSRLQSSHSAVDGHKKLRLEELCDLSNAAVYGSGCWATRREPNQVGVACCTSGCGEHLIKTMLAKECATLALTRDAVRAVQEGLGDKFLGSTFLSSMEQKLGGVLLLGVEGGDGVNDCTVDLVWGHTTQSMCIGYMAEQDRKPAVKSETLFISPPFSSLKTKSAAGSQKTNNKIHRHELEIKCYVR